MFYVTGGDADQETGDNGHGVSSRILAWYTGMPPSEEWVEAGQMVSLRRKQCLPSMLAKHGVKGLPASAVAGLCK